VHLYVSMINCYFRTYAGELAKSHKCLTMLMQYLRACYPRIVYSLGMEWIALTL